MVFVGDSKKLIQAGMYFPFYGIFAEIEENIMELALSLWSITKAEGDGRGSGRRT
jgi:hypothetical protein